MAQPPDAAGLVSLSTSATGHAGAGINGAGKTSTLQILSGDSVPTSGSAKLLGLDILTDQLKVRRLLGYCPQFDALFGTLRRRL